MATFIYSTSSSTAGPWLIDADQILHLDRLLDDEWERLKVANADAIQTEISRLAEDDAGLKAIETDAYGAVEAERHSAKRQKELETRVRSYSWHREERALIIRFKNRKRIPVESFKEACRHPELLDEVPIGFSFKMRAGAISCELELDTLGYLEVRVSPEDREESRQLFATIQHWARTAAAPSWQKLWVKVNPFQVAIWIFLIAILGQVFVVDEKTASKQYYQDQSRRLLSEGVTPENQPKAIETLLALDAEYVVPGQKAHASPWFLFLAIGGLVISVLLCVTPRPLLGIGKGQAAILRWRAWIRVIFVVIPVFVFGNVLWPILSRLLWSLF